MTTQFLDVRVSVHNNGVTGTSLINTTPILVGDIGLQTLGAVNTTDARIMLVGTVGIQLQAEEETFDNNVIMFRIERNGTAAYGAGTTILIENLAVTIGGGSTLVLPFTVSGGDFPSSATVLAGQIRYTLFVFLQNPPAAGATYTLVGPVVFNGVAASGNN